MADTKHSSKSRSHQQHHKQLAPPSQKSWPPYQKLLISTPYAVRLQDAEAQSTLVELEKVHSMSVATSSDAGCRVMVAHNDSILLRDHHKRKDTLYRLRGSEVSKAAFSKWLELTDFRLESPQSSSSQTLMIFFSGRNTRTSYVATLTPSIVSQITPVSIQVNRLISRFQYMGDMSSVCPESLPQCTCKTCAGRRRKYQ